MATPPAFPIRFKDPSTKEMLRLVSDQLGVPMNDVAEAAIRNELILLGVGIERQLTEIVAALRSYSPAADLDRLIEEIGAGEELGDPLRATRVESSSTGKRFAGLTTGKVIMGRATAKKGAVSAPQLAGALASFKKK